MNFKKIAAIVAPVAVSFAILTTCHKEPEKTTLFYTPGTAAMGPHIVARELNMSVNLVKVDLSAHKTESGQDYYQINPKGRVPAIKKGDFILTESVAIMQYLADQDPNHRLLPASGQARYAVLEMANFIAMDLHHNLLVLLHDKFQKQGMTIKDKAVLLENAQNALLVLDKKLDNKYYLVDNKISIVDPYLFNMLMWLKHVDITLEKFPSLKAFETRMSAMGSVKTALSEEGLAPKSSTKE